jgi:hypothetical protein
VPLTRTYRRLSRPRVHTSLLEALRRQPAEWWATVPGRLAQAAAQQGIVIDDGPKSTQPVSIQLTPWLITEAQCRYLQFLGTRLRRVVNRLLKSYFQDEMIRAVLPLNEAERAWLQDLAPNGFPEPSPVFERLDTNLLIDDPQWESSLQILEFNGVGVGCLHFMPAANALVEEHVLPTLRPVIASPACRSPEDPRVLLRKLLEAHAKAIGRRSAVTAFVERREACLGGADEMRRVSDFLKAQGLPTVYADPRELEVRDGELVYKDTVVDLVYRDFMLEEVVSIERHGGRVEAMKHAFRRNQVVSGLTGEFDHKSMLECLSNPQFAKYFTPSQRRTLQAFVPWTRLIFQRKTIDPSGREVDLLEYARQHREGLVLKPNRSYGGENVVIGASATQAAWETAVAEAMEHPSTYVVQEFVRLPQVEFISPVNGHQPVNEFVTVGFTATAHGIAFLGRSSGNRIVNITRGGNLVPVFIVR